jgi:hypothetical protein
MSGKGPIEAAGRRTRQFSFARAAFGFVGLSPVAQSPTCCSTIPGGGGNSMRRAAEGRRLAWFVNGLSRGERRARKGPRVIGNRSPWIRQPDLAIRWPDICAVVRRPTPFGVKDAVKASPKDSSCLAQFIYLRHLHKPELAAKYAQTAMRLRRRHLRMNRSGRSIFGRPGG